MKGSGSRWDDLRDIHTVPSSSAKSSTRRLMPSHVQRDNQHIAKCSRENSNVANGSWRRPQNSNKVAAMTSKEEKTRRAIESLKVKVARYAKSINSSTSNDSDEESVGASLEEVSVLVYGSSDPLRILERKAVYSSCVKSSFSLFFLWEAADTTFDSLKLLSPSKSCNLLIKMSSFAAALLQVIHDSIQHSFDPLNPNGSFHRPRSMTDLRLCACASILFEILHCCGQRLGIDDATLLECKASLFACLAEILKISTTICLRDSSNKNRRSLLFPWGAERTVNLVVSQSVLPLVNSVMSDNVLMTSSSKIKYCSHAMESLFMLLKDPSGDSKPPNPQLSKHAAALLSPLVIDVKPDGQENQTPNPLRSGTLHAIVTFWNCFYQLTQEESLEVLCGNDIACQCLTAALDSLYALNKGKAPHSENESPPLEIDAVSICRHTQNLLQNERLNCNRSKFLQLFSSLCRTFPGAAASQWHLFLEQSVPQLRGPTMASLPLLLSFVDTGTAAMNDHTFESKSIIILPDTLHSIFVLLSSMPFPHWIAEDSKPRMRLSGENFFASRVRTSMLRVISSQFRLMRSIRGIISDLASASIEKMDTIQSMDSIITHTAQLTLKLCTVLPYNGQNSVLLRPASKLVGCAGEIYVLCTKAIEDTIARQTAPSCLKLYENARDVFSHIITGAADTKSTQNEPSLSPAQHWISDPSSFEFIELLLSRGSSSLGGKRMSMLSCVVMICPWTLTREPFNLAAFCELCTIQCNFQNDPEQRLSGVELVKSFMIGRNTFSSDVASFDVSTVIVDSFCPLLLSALDDPHANVRGAAVVSFGYMSAADWMALFRLRNNVKSLDCRYLDAILRHSSTAYGENNARVRSLACKAIGDISTYILNHSMDEPLFTDEFATLFTQKICYGMDGALIDECPLVRSMGLFAKGNLALALKERNFRGTMLPLLPHLRTSFSSACKCLDDKDEKVVTNAIRAVGHLSYFVYSSDFLSTTEPCESTKLNAYKDALLNLTIKLKRALDDAIEAPSAHLTWNQRNNVKKHAWGSCTTIGMLLTFSHVLQHVGNIFIESVLLEQFRCVQLSNAIHDKIAAAAVNSLVKLPTSFWHMLPDNCDSIGRGLLSCFCYLCNVSKQKTPLSSYHRNIPTLASMLLHCANAKDFRHLFLLSDNTSFSVDFFYQWLVTYHVSTEVMEEISVAVQDEEVQRYLDVSMVQMFMSRTVYQFKEQESQCKSVCGDSAQTDDCDEL